MNALNAYNKLNANVAGLKKSSEKLSSGYRINRAGDDAAGLAISEKMRSQIRGLNQAVRNSQDGINMIQTYEGAAQESHSILQRMKELASESANGTYDNMTDRAALQLEFDQLNDELNQIADTDFNGTVVLNGGQMADGLKAVNGEFNYANYIRDPKQLSASDVTVVDYQDFDDPTADPAANHGYTNADKFWNALNSKWERGNASKADDGPDYVDVTFQYDETGGADGNTFWKAVSASNGADVAQIKPNSEDPTGATSNGGFSITAGGVTAAKVVLDSTKLVNGDTITVRLNNPNSAKAAPTLAGAERASSTIVQGSQTTAIKDDAIDLDVKLGTTGTDFTDADMTEAFNELFNSLNGATLSAKYDGKATMTTTDGKLSLTFYDPDGNKIDIKNDTATNGFAKFEITSNGKKYAFGAKIEANGKITIGTVDDAGTGLAKTAITLQVTDDAATDTTKGGTSGTVTFNINLENNKYDTTNKPNVEVKPPIDAAVSRSNSFTNSTARMTYTDHIILQTGARTKDSVDFTFSYNANGTADMGTLKANLDISSRENGLNTANLSLANQDDANYAIDQIDKAINKVSMVRATFGSIQNRLEHKITNLTTTSENLQEAESSIRDTDMASEMMNYTKFNILQQAAQSMLAQANQQPQSILQLLG